MLIWFLTLAISSVPFWIGDFGFGYDANVGKCQIISCSIPSDSNIILSAREVTLTLGVGLPFFLILVASIIIFKTCFNGQTNEIHKVTSVLIFCYVAFILPIYILEWIPYSHDYFPKITLLIYSWYWLIYIINVFVYIISVRVCRDAIGLFLRDLLDIRKLFTIQQDENSNVLSMGRIGTISNCEENSLSQSS